MVAKDTCCGSETYRPYLDIERIINVQSPRSITRGHDHELEIKDEKMFRFALLRAQIDSELRMNEDIQMHQRRRYVAQVIEKMIFGELLIEIGTPFMD